MRQQDCVLQKIRVRFDINHFAYFPSCLNLTFPLADSELLIEGKVSDADLYLEYSATPSGVVKGGNERTYILHKSTGKQQNIHFPNVDNIKNLITLLRRRMQGRRSLH